MRQGAGRAVERGDIYVVNLDPTSGHEQRGQRPVMVLSVAEFNKATGVPIVAPITSGGNFARVAGFTVPLAGVGTQTTGVVRCDQPRALDIRARGGRFVERAPDEITTEVLNKLSIILE